MPETCTVGPAEPPATHAQENTYGAPSAMKAKDPEAAVAWYTTLLGDPTPSSSEMFWYELVNVNVVVCPLTLCHWNVTRSLARNCSVERVAPTVAEKCEGTVRTDRTRTDVNATTVPSTRNPSSRVRDLSWSVFAGEVVATIPEPDASTAQQPNVSYVPPLPGWVAPELSSESGRATELPREAPTMDRCPFGWDESQDLRSEGIRSAPEIRPRPSPSERSLFHNAVRPPVGVWFHRILVAAPRGCRTGKPYSPGPPPVRSAGAER